MRTAPARERSPRGHLDRYTRNGQRPGAGPHQRTGPSVGLPWHTLAAHDVCARLGVDADAGLTLAHAADRARRHGPNALREKAARAPWRMLLDQFADFMILVLIVAAVISGIDRRRSRTRSRSS